MRSLIAVGWVEVRSLIAVGWVKRPSGPAQKATHPTKSATQHPQRHHINPPPHPSPTAPSGKGTPQCNPPSHPAHKAEPPSPPSAPPFSGRYSSAIADLVGWVKRSFVQGDHLLDQTKAEPNTLDPVGFRFFPDHKNSSQPIKSLHPTYFSTFHSIPISRLKYIGSIPQSIG